MRFLIDANLPRPVKAKLESYGHEAVDTRDVGLRTEPDPVIARYAQMEQLCLLTADFDFANIRDYPPRRFAGIVVLKIPLHATTHYVLQLLDNFLAETEIIAQLYGKLAIVEPGRVRLRTS